MVCFHLLLLDNAIKYDISNSSFHVIRLPRYIALTEFRGPRGIRTLVTGSEGQIECNLLGKPDLEKFLKLRSINGISDGWLHDVRVTLDNYMKFVGWSIDENKTLEYLEQLYGTSEKTS